MSDEKMTPAMLAEARNIAATVTLDLRRFGSTTLLDTKALARVAAALLGHVDTLTKERDEASAINVGALRAQVCAVAGRLREVIDRADWEDALGLTTSQPATDFAEAFRELLRLAQVRVTENDHDLLCHDLLREQHARIA